MLEIIQFMLGIAWRVIAIYIGFLLLKELIRGGSDTVREMIETIGVAFRAALFHIRKALVEKVQRERRNEQPVHDEGD